MADAAKQFTQEYKYFATAVDTTRHELPVKNFYIDGDRMTFLGWYYSVQFATLLESEENLGVSWIYLLCIGFPPQWMCLYTKTVVPTHSDKATASLKESEEVLLQCTQGAHHGNEKSAECLRGMKTAAQDISKQLSG